MIGSNFICSIGRYAIWSEHAYICEVQQFYYCLQWQVVANGYLDLIQHGAPEVRGPLDVALSHRLDVVFVVSTDKAHHWCPQVLDFSVDFPVRCTSSPRDVKRGSEVAALIVLVTVPGFLRQPPQ